MQLSQEDSLRLNVLLHQNVQAIRIDEGKMQIHGLTEKGEARIQLNPNCKDELYIRRIKEVISSYVLGSPGGYPVYLKRWTRMGQARSESLESLLKLGEPEAVVAVVGASGITDEIARRAWWAMPNADNARRMLATEAVACGMMGRVLAEFLLEFMPFEEDPGKVIESVRLVLQPGLINEQQRQQLWQKGLRKNTFLVGFLSAVPDDLPETSSAHPRYPAWQTALEPLVAQNNAPAKMLLRIASPHGQAFLHTVETVLKKPANQDVVVALFKAIEYYFNELRPHREVRRDITQILEESQVHSCANNASCFCEQLSHVYGYAPETQPVVESMLVFSCIGEQLLNPVFALTDAVGSVMRRKIEPLTQPLTLHLRRMLNQA